MKGVAQLAVVLFLQNARRAIGRVELRRRCGERGVVRVGVLRGGRRSLLALLLLVHCSGGGDRSCCDYC